MDLAIAERKANDLIHKHLTGWQFKWSTAHTLLGQCRYSSKTIFLSKSISAINSEEEVIDTILHEIAHALAGSGHGHDAVWKRYCVMVGCRPKSTGPIQAETVEQRKIVGAKWLLIDDTGKIWKHWVRKPTQKTFDRMPYSYMPGFREQTEGKLRIVPV